MWQKCITDRPLCSMRTCGGTGVIQRFRILLLIVRTIYLNVYLRGERLCGGLQTEGKVGGFSMGIGALAGRWHIPLDGIWKAQ